jgi:L-alanine-DL-glutamate epimerase-like enolase superfamily enzyme
VVADGFTAIKFDLDTPNPYTIDITDDPHPRRRWFEPFNRVIGSQEMAWMVEVARAVREAVGPAVMVAMDAHWKFNVNDAIKLAQALEPYDLLWLEDPVPPENIEAQRHVTHSTRTPICTGENLYRKHGYRELIERQAARIIAPDIPRWAGSWRRRRLPTTRTSTTSPWLPITCRARWARSRPPMSARR